MTSLRNSKIMESWTDEKSKGLKCLFLGIAHIFSLSGQQSAKNADGIVQRGREKSIKLCVLTVIWENNHSTRKECLKRPVQKTEQDMWFHSLLSSKCQFLQCFEDFRDYTFVCAFLSFVQAMYKGSKSVLLFWWLYFRFCFKVLMLSINITL